MEEEEEEGEEGGGTTWQVGRPSLSCPGHPRAARFRFLVKGLYLGCCSWFGPAEHRPRELRPHGERSKNDRGGP